uniref:Ty3 transposon capsid-like protein domain-containing protein n=1 Tax=Salix viminalis TaxID=40686 RepID=A0A6N2MPH0_SALVM
MEWYSSPRGKEMRFMMELGFLMGFFLSIYSGPLWACPGLSNMAPKTRSQDVRRMEDSLEVANQRVNGMEAKLQAQSDDLAQLKTMMKEIATQQLTIKQTLQNLSGEAREEIHKWLYKCNQYFDLEEIPEADKLKLASYYLDGMALYWHQNYTMNLKGQEVTWTEYVEALCCRFGGQRDPLKELTEHKQEGGDLELYIKDFDELWNRAHISERQALMFFLGGLEFEIKNLVKMFEPKSLKQAYNLARLHNNTLTHRKITPYYPRSQGHMFSYPPPVKPTYTTNTTKPEIHPGNQSSQALLPTPTTFHPHNNLFYSSHKPSKTIRTQEMDDRRAKGLCFWCDENFVPGHKCRNRRLYSLCIVDDEGDDIEEEND